MEFAPLTAPQEFASTLLFAAQVAVHPPLAFVPMILAISGAALKLHAALAVTAAGLASAPVVTPYQVCPFLYTFIIMIEYIGRLLPWSRRLQVLSRQLRLCSPRGQHRYNQPH